MTNPIQYNPETNQRVILSDAALQHVLTYLAKQKDCKGIRFSIKKTGCSGMSYVIDYVSAPKENDIVQKLTNDYQLFIDKASFPAVKGTFIDYIKKNLDYKLVFNNPNQTGLCGCGESFKVD